jgi:hypothetical protein
MGHLSKFLLGILSVGPFESATAQTQAPIQMLQLTAKGKPQVRHVQFRSCPEYNECLSIKRWGPNVKLNEVLYTPQFSFDIKIDRPSHLTLDWQASVICSGRSMQESPNLWSYQYTLQLQLGEVPVSFGQQFGFAFLGDLRRTGTEETFSALRPVHFSRTFEIPQSGTYTYAVGAGLNLVGIKDVSCDILYGDVTARLSR